MARTAVKTEVVEVTDEPGLLVAAVGTVALPNYVIVENTGSHPVFLGGASVAASGAERGLTLAADEKLELALAGVELYAVAAAGQTVDVVVAFLRK